MNTAYKCNRTRIVVALFRSAFFAKYIVKPWCHRQIFQMKQGSGCIQDSEYTRVSNNLQTTGCIATENAAGSLLDIHGSTLRPADKKLINVLGPLS